MMDADEFEPTEAQKRAGWTRAMLRDYVEGRQRSTLEAADPRRPQPKPDRANSKYRVKRWRVPR